MIIRTKHFGKEYDKYASIIGRKEDIAFFDIETTGLSAWKSGLYLIGAMVYDVQENEWILTQFFAEDVCDERDVIASFFSLLEDKKILVSFNGDGFDIPFINVMLNQYGMSYSFSDVESYDIYKKIKPVKKLLNLKNYKLKTCEQFLGIYREDIYDGGQLIYVYNDYLHDRDPEKLEMLLLHNAEDLSNLPPVLEIMRYQSLLSGSLDISESEVVELANGSQVLSLIYEGHCSVPVTVDYERDGINLNITDNRLNICIPLYEGELKLFFDDYKNYYYLPEEDMAVHKSVGEFVDSSKREKANKSNCYQKQYGIYLPEKEAIFTPSFKREVKDKVVYAMYDKKLFDDSIKAAAYVKSVFKSIF